MSQKSTKGARIKRSFAQSTYITTGWNWFMILAGKAAEPVLVASVLYASVKLLASSWVTLLKEGAKKVLSFWR